MRMLHNRILVRPNEVEAKTKGGIIIPETSISKPSKGTIVLSGSPLMKEGEVVNYSKFSGTAIYVNGEDLLVLNEDDISIID